MNTSASEKLFGIWTAIYLFVAVLLMAGPMFFGWIGEVLFFKWNVREILGFNVEALMWAPILSLFTIPGTFVWLVVWGIVGCFIPAKKLGTPSLGNEDDISRSK